MRVLPSVLLTCATFAFTALAAEPDYNNPATYGPASKARVDYELDITIRAYDKVGLRDKKWDDDARAAILAGVRVWGEFPRKNGDENDTAFFRSDAALSKGCPDPLLIFVRARALAQYTGPVKDVIELDKRAVAGFRKSQYPPILTTMALLRRANDATRDAPGDELISKNARSHIDDALALLPQVLADPKISTHAVIELLDLIGAASGHAEAGDRGKYLAPALAIMDASRVPQSVVLTAKANAYNSWAWDARGTGYANTVANDSWQKMNDRLAIARKALEDAWALDDQNSEAARIMSYLEHVQSTGPGVYETWFDRETTLDPDDPRSTYGHMIHLLPQWGGSIEQMIAFGKQRVEENRWTNLGPLTLAEAYWYGALYDKDRLGRGPSRAYFERSPEIFDELKPIYDHYFNDPDASYFHKTRYAVIAAYSGKWKEADAMFKQLGDHRHRAVLFDDAAMDALAKEAAEKAKSE